MRLPSIVLLLYVFSVLNAGQSTGFLNNGKFPRTTWRFNGAMSGGASADDSPTNPPSNSEKAQLASIDTNANNLTKGNRWRIPTLPSAGWKGLMLLICVIWATNFAVIKKIFDSLPDGVLDPSLYVATRFTIAALIMAPGLKGNLRNPALWKNGFILGLCVFVGYIGQSMGILTSTASKTAFFCSLNVVWVALVSGIRKRKFRARTWVSVLLAISGAAFIELKGVEAPTPNDLWLLLQPIGFGSGYLVLEQNMKDFPDSAQAVTSIKLLTVAAFTLLWAGYNGHTLSDLKPIFSNRVAAAGLLYTSVVTTAFAIWLQSVVFKRVSSTDASIILTSEPLWAALFAVVMIGEVLSRHDLTGGALIILGCLLNEIDVGAKLREAWTAHRRGGAKQTPMQAQQPQGKELRD